ncbi:asparagine synthase-related protein [Streptomyces sp. NPDC004685]
MCGIAGLAGPDTARHERTVSTTGRSQHHRGPDGTMHAATSDGHAVLAMNTLLIVDPGAEPGPYLDRQTGLLLAFYGELHNYRQQAAAWGIPLAAQETDAHLVLKAWAKLGPSCLQGLDGMFALAVYDPRVGRLFLVRGGLGEQPLYWCLDGGRLAFASEVTTLTGYGPAPLVLRPRCWPSRARSAPTPPSRASNSSHPQPCCRSTSPTGSLDQHVFWRLEDRLPFTGTYNEALAKYSVVLVEQVPLRAPGCDFALLLSGGLDSSVLAYLMRPPVCVTFRYRGHDRLDESVLAARTSAELVVVEPDPLDFPEALPDMMGALDYPMGNASTFLASSTKQSASQSPTWTSPSRSVTSTALAN